MEILNTKNDNTLTLALTGRLDTVTAPELETELAANLDGVEELILDFSALDYISSAGLRVLLAAQKRMNTQGSMKVTNINADIREVFEITGFCDILTIE
ncbi:MAG: STAS domain-containing protein [Clostridia bacterium]|nr:STAS domain-containing protein [Clostridia bacterium]